MALDRQVDGDHYKGFAIQPIEYCMKNGMDPIQHNVIKYVSRYKEKGGVSDLLKAIHYLELLIEWEETRFEVLPAQDGR